MVDAAPTPVGASVAVETPAVEFRHTPIHFGKNRGLTRADLSPQQIHWYETEWMLKKEVEGLRGEGDETLVAGLRAYRAWREAEKAAEPSQAGKKKRAGRGAQASPTA